MKIVVDRVRCQNHGQCAISAPSHFEMDEDGELRYEERFESGDALDVEDAVGACPVQAIVLTDENT